MSEPLIDAELLEIMQCPLCAGGLHEEHEPPSLVCDECGHRYPVIDGIPDMVVEN